ncbi:MAG: DNA-3-methyladenine glycosylase I [Pseudomonadales bacterium]|nr:DNA-3-methyladenine glycosylase I [Halioglobus sp.]MCP5123557.1 DNA-3-methyladenine glycosylase I [Pseudomonadales bacterium]MCP5193605.1 DNA-3-methyladenine glycosylase I [Pseudomonadales bacterium]
MEKFATIYQRACERKGGEAALKRLMPRVRSPRALAGTGDDRYLAEMTRCVFQAGFVWRVVDHKWDDFEDVFFGFPPEKIVLLSPDQIDRFSQNPRIIRNRQKVLSVQHNARFILEVAREHGSFGKFISRWPATDLVGLFAYMKKHGSRLGGMTGQRVLRNRGKDTFVVTGDVTRCLQQAGADITANPASKRELALIQSTFNTWQDESGLPYSHISRICACSLG